MGYGWSGSRSTVGGQCGVVVNKLDDRMSGGRLGQLQIKASCLRYH